MSLTLPGNWFWMLIPSSFCQHKAILAAATETETLLPKAASDSGMQSGC
jgi:hypothetical protein